MSVRQRWSEWLRDQRAPRVLEIGVKEWDGVAPKHGRAGVLALNPAARWVGLDLEPGADVSIVADVHHLGAIVAASFDAILCPWVLEHLRRPWDAAGELANVLRRGGLLYVQTHQCFPYHAYPRDYWRFTREALGELFSPASGWQMVESEYLHPCRVVPLDNEFAAGNEWNFAAEAWLAVECIAEKL